MMFDIITQMMEHNLDPRALTYSIEWAAYTKKATSYQRFLLHATPGKNYTQWGYAGLFLTLLENSSNNPRLNNLREEIENATNQGMIATNALATHPFDGVKVMEVGGPFGQVLHALGAEVWCIDPDINSKSAFQKVDWAYSPIRRPQLYHPVPQRITLENWEELISEGSFDVVYSKLVLSIDSGTSSDWRKHIPDYRHDYHEAQAEYERLRTENRAAEEQARKEIFVVSGLATKPGGLVIHEGDALSEVKSFEEDADLQFVERRLDYLFDHETRRPYWGSELLVFKKAVKPYLPHIS